MSDPKWMPKAGEAVVFLWGADGKDELNETNGGGAVRLGIVEDAPLATSIIGMFTVRVRVVNSTGRKNTILAFTVNELRPASPEEAAALRLMES